MIRGYKVSKFREGKSEQLIQRLARRQYSTATQIRPKLLSMEETAKILNLPTTGIEKIYNETKQLEDLTVSATENIGSLKSRIENIERTAVNSGAHIVPDIIKIISQAKEKVRQLELTRAEELDPISEAKKEIEELEREKRTLEETKRAVMEKYYNREIDEAPLKSITDNYEQRLDETNIRIKNWEIELEKLEKDPALPKQNTNEKKERFFAAQEAVNLSMPISRAPQISTPSQYPSKIEMVKRQRETPEGFEIPQIPKKAIKIGSLEAETEIPYIFLTYPLIPKHPGKTEIVYAYAKILWDENNNRYVYNLVEPILTEKLKGVYAKVKEMLEQRLDIDFSKLKKIKAKEYLDEQIDDVLKYFYLVLTENEKRILKYYMNRDFTGLEVIEPLLQDPNIEDINCDGVGIPIFVFHRNPDIGSIATNISFDDTDKLDSFLIRLAQLCGKSISVSQPLLDGKLPDGSRIQSTLGTDIARRGSNFTIRKFSEEPLTPVHLIQYGTLNSEILAYLWFVVDYGRNVLVSGGTATGKTSFLNVLSLFIRPERKIVSIEDTAELRLPHAHWVPVVARTVIAAEGKGEVDMFELLRESLRQRPDYIVVGEVRGKEAYILFQQMATGHPSLATIHAENVARLTDRLTTPPISLPAGLISTVDIVVFLARMRYKNKFIRKVIEIDEIAGFDANKNTPIINQIFKWNPRNDKFEITGKSLSLKKISELTGISEKDIKSEIERRIVVLEWMKESNILDYRDVHRIFSLYYTDPKRLLSAIQGAGW